MDFPYKAKGLARNPLGIIALFIVLIYGFASLVVGFSGNLQPVERLPIVWFLVVFPVVVLTVFSWLVSQHHEKLYAPRDYSSDDAFLRGISERSKQRQGIIELERDAQEKFREMITSVDFVSALNEETGDVRSKLAKVAEKVTREIRNSSSITIDARGFTGSKDAIYEYPMVVFPSLGDLTDEVYFRLSDYIEPYEYGYTWVLKKKGGGGVIKNARMITRSRAGVPVGDVRTLSEVGITGGMELEVAQP